MSIDKLFRNIDPDISNILNKALSDKTISFKETEKLFESSGIELQLICMVADELRRRKNGEIVSYVINRNINYTNVCIKQCGFCAFSRDFRQDEGYMLPMDEIVRRAKEAWSLGATEVCIQAGLVPDMDGFFYVEICRAIKKEIPDIHIHAFSPEEILYGANRSNLKIIDYLKLLKEAGLGSLPGTSAEILVESIRKKISPGRIKVEDWIKVITTAHNLDIPTTSTIMYGHVESINDIVTHLEIIRNIQKETNRFSEFVPLSFIHNEAPMFNLNLVDNIKGANGLDTIKMHSISRIFFNNFIDNIQVSWVKEGSKLSQVILGVGANDLGGCLINESISTSAGSQYGQFLKPIEMRKIIKACGKIPAQRTSTYKVIKEFTDPTEIESKTSLDQIDPEIFGSYKELIKINDFKYKKNERSRK